MVKFNEKAWQEFVKRFDATYTPEEKADINIVLQDLLILAGFAIMFITWVLL